LNAGAAGPHPQAMFEENNNLRRLTGGLDELPANSDKDMLLSKDDIKSMSGRLGSQTWRLHKHEGTDVDLWREQNADAVFFYQLQLLVTHRMNYVSEKRRGEGGGGGYACYRSSSVLDENVSSVVGRTHAGGRAVGGGGGFSRPI
jgi:hypothetical protein